MSTDFKSNLDRMRESFEWFSRVGRREIELTRADMSRFFTDDVRMVVDNRIKGSGIEGLHDRFKEMLELTSRWEVELMSPSLSEGDRAAAYCQYRFVDREGRPGLVHTCSIWTLRDGRIAEIFEVAAFDSLRLDLADHGPGAGRAALA